MVAGVGDVTAKKLQSSLVANWPAAIDVYVDITVQGTADTYQRQLLSGLRTRGLLDVLRRKPITLAAIEAASPDSTEDDIKEHYDSVLSDDNEKLETIADLLVQVVKFEKLLQTDKDRLNGWVKDGDGRSLFAWLISATTLSTGKAQDIIRAAYVKVAVAPSDSAKQIITAVEKKWWLYKQNTLFTTKTDAGVREGITEINKMLLQAPTQLAASASSQLTTVKTANFPNAGEDYIEAFVTMLQEHGDRLVGSTQNDSGQLMVLQRRVAELEGGRKGGGGGGGNEGVKKKFCDCGSWDCEGVNNKTGKCVLDGTSEDVSTKSKYAFNRGKDIKWSQLAKVHLAREVCAKQGKAAAIAWIKSAKGNGLEGFSEPYKSQIEAKKKELKAKYGTGTGMMMLPGACFQMAAAGFGSQETQPCNTSALLEALEEAESESNASGQGGQLFMLLPQSQKAKAAVDAEAMRDVGIGVEDTPLSLLRAPSSRRKAEKDKPTEMRTKATKSLSFDDGKGVLPPEAHASPAKRSVFSQAHQAEGTQLKQVLEGAALEFTRLGLALATQENVDTASVLTLARGVKFDREKCDSAYDALSQIMHDDDSFSNAPVASHESGNSQADKNEIEALRSLVADLDQAKQESDERIRKLEESVAEKKAEADRIAAEETAKLAAAKLSLDKAVADKIAESEAAAKKQAAADLSQQEADKLTAEAFAMRSKESVGKKVSKPLKNRTLGMQATLAMLALIAVASAVWMQVGSSREEAVARWCSIDARLPACPMFWKSVAEDVPPVSDVLRSEPSAPEPQPMRRDEAALQSTPSDEELRLSLKQELAAMREDMRQAQARAAAQWKTRLASERDAMLKERQEYERQDAEWRAQLASERDALQRERDQRLSAEEDQKVASKRVQSALQMIEEANKRERDLLTTSLDLDQQLRQLQQREEQVQDAVDDPETALDSLDQCPALLPALEEAEPPLVRPITGVEWQPNGVAMPMLSESVATNKSKPVLVLFAGDHRNRPQQSSVAIQIRTRGWSAVEYDNAEGYDHQDLSLSANQAPILRKLRRGEAAGMHAEPPCSTHSVLDEQQLRPLAHPDGRPDLPQQLKEKVNHHNTLSDFAIEACWAAYEGNTSWSLEFPAFRGDAVDGPARAFWPAKANHAAIIHRARLISLIDASGARIVTLSLCNIGGNTQKYISLVIWPPWLAKHFDQLDGKSCMHMSHAKVATGQDADASKVYPPAFDVMIADIHARETHVATTADLGMLAAMTPGNASLVRFLGDNGASDAFAPTDEHCMPGTDGPPTVSNVIVGAAGTTMTPAKSCIMPLGVPNTSQVIMPRINIANVPMAVMSEGLLLEQFGVRLVRGPNEEWTATFPSGAVLTIAPGPGRLSRLGFMTFETRPAAAAMLMLPVVNTSNVTADPVPMDVVEDEPTDGVLLLSAHTPAHVHMRQPVYSELELLQLYHCRHMFPSTDELIATHDARISVGHDFAKIKPAAVKEFHKRGSSIANSVFMKQSAVGGPQPRAAPDKPVGYFDTFGPVKVPSVYYGYRFANSSVWEPWGLIVTGGSVGMTTDELTEAVSAGRSVVQPFKGEVPAVRTDALRATTTAKKWKEYVHGPVPIDDQHSVAGKHWQMALIEIIHKQAWPMVLSSLLLQRRGLKWWYVCWRHAIMLINIKASRRDGDTNRSSRWLNFYEVPFNQSVLRVILSPCQYYVSSEQRYKSDAKARNGLWCGISPDNASAAWVWQGSQFITVAHGDLRTNEWVAWSIAPVGTDQQQLTPHGQRRHGTPAVDVFDEEGEFDLFTDETTHHVSSLVTPPEMSATEFAALEVTRREAVQAVPTAATAVRHADEVASRAANVIKAAECEQLIAQRLERMLRAGEKPGPKMAMAADVLRRKAAGQLTDQDEAPRSHFISRFEEFMDEPPESGGVEEATVTPIVDTAQAAKQSISNHVSSETTARAETIQHMTRAKAKAAGVLMTIASDAQLSSVFETENATEFDKATTATNAYWDATDVVDELAPTDEAAAALSEAYMMIAINEATAKEKVRESILKFDAIVDKRIKQLTVTEGEQAYLMELHADGGPDMYDSLYLLTSGDPEDAVPIKGAVGVLGAMIQVYNELGEPVSMDEPQTWGEYLKSPDKSLWTDAIVSEVTKLEDVETWVRVPRSEARKRGKVVHRGKLVFKVKTDAQKKFDRRKARFVIMATSLRQGRDYLEHYTCGAQMASIKMVCITVVHRKWMRFKLDVNNAFPQEPIDSLLYFELPKGPFDWRDPVSGEEQIGELKQNLYGTKQGPRIWTKGYTKHHVEVGQMSRCYEDDRVFSRGDATDGIIVSVYMDESFGGGTPDRVMWYIEMIRKRYPCEVEFEWGTILGAGADVDDDGYLEFSCKKYIREIAAKFLKGESKPTRVMPARESIDKLPAEIDKLPPVGSPEDLEMRPLQEEARSLNGALVHLSRLNCMVGYPTAVCSQQAARMSHAGMAHQLEIARFAWAHEDDSSRHCGPGCKSLVINPRLEPIRPYDPEGLVEYGLYIIGDGAQATPNETVPNSKSMGGLAIMFGGGIIDHKIWRLHTCTPDSTSVETMVTSRAVSRGMQPRGVAQFLGIPQGKTPVYVDNDGTWYVARDATSATSMTYIIRHVRFIQQAEYDRVVKHYQIDGALNPVDAFTKYLDKQTWTRHMAFLMGYPELALQLWNRSVKKQSYKLKKIVPVSPLESES